MTDESKSGTDVPAARKVRPMTGSGIPMAFPNVVAHQTIKYEAMAIQMMLMKNVRGYQFRQASLRQSGTVNAKRKTSGAEMIQNACTAQCAPWG